MRREVIRLYEAGNHREAAEVARRLLDVQRRILGESHPDYATGLSTLSLLLQKQGDVAGAAGLLGEVIAIRRAALGIHHPETVRAESLLAALAEIAPGLTGPTIAPSDAALRSSPLPDPDRPGPEPASAPARDTSGFADEVAEVAEASADPRALAVLESVLTLEHSGIGELASLRNCQEAALTLREAVVAGRSDDQADRLTKGEHPFAALLSLVERPGSLSDAEWANFYESVSAAFGSGLARAASRGRVRLARPSSRRAGSESGPQTPDAPTR